MASPAIEFNANRAPYRDGEAIARAASGPDAECDQFFGEGEAPQLDGNAGTGILWSLGVEAIAGVVLWGIWWGWRLWIAHP